MNIEDHTIKQDLASQGVWLEYDGGKFLIASSGSEEFKRRAAKAYRNLQQGQRKNPDLVQKIATELTADCVLLNWEGVHSNGKALPCTREAKLALLRNAPDFSAWVSEQAAEIANFQKEALAEDATDLKSGASLDHEAREAPGIPAGDS